MKFRVTLKDPDGVGNSISEEAQRMETEITNPLLTADARRQIRESFEESLSEVTDKWLAYGEYVTIEFDTEAKTATVVEEGK